MRLNAGLAKNLAEPELLIASAKSEQAQRVKGIQEKLGNPISITPIIRTERLDPKVRAGLKLQSERVISSEQERRVEIDGRTVEILPVIKTSENPELALHEYVRLTYLSQSDRDAALKAMQSDPFFRAARKELTSQLSGEPLYDNVVQGTASSPQSGITGQWGPHALQMSQLWSLTPGHGHVAIIDSGTTTAHPDLTKSLRKHRSWNFFPRYSGCENDDVNASGTIGLTDGHGHGTHVHGIIAAEHSNNAGVRGQCARCNVQVAKITSCNGGGAGISEADQIDAIRRMIRSGANVVNMSLSAGVHSCGTATPGTQSGSVKYQYGGYTNDANDAYCMLLKFASDADVQIVGASGNNNSALQFPASDPRTVAVGGAQLGETHGSLTSLELWNAKQWKEQSPARPSNEIREIGTNFGANQWLSAPARDIVSTFHPGSEWGALGRCGSGALFGPDTNTPKQYSWTDQFGYTLLTAPGLPATYNVGQGYGICSGTSMSAPFVSGLLGITRSAIPLMNAKSYQTPNSLGTWRSVDMRTLLKNSARIPDGAGGFLSAGAFSQYWGYGIARGGSVASQLSAYAKGAPEDYSFETPLIEQEELSGNDFFYTTVPTQAAAAYFGGLLWPRTSSTQIYCGSRFASRVVDTYRSPAGAPALVPSSSIVPTGGFGQVNPPPGQPFPPPTSCNYTMPERLKANFRVMTTPVASEGTPLLALNRYSVVIDAGGGEYAGRHIYVARAPTAPTDEFAQYGWKFDGIEGYIYPATASAPRGDMEQLWLMLRPSTYTYALVLNSAIAGWQARGYQLDSTGSACIGCAMGWVSKIY